jgi:hypothetical protein
MTNLVETLKAVIGSFQKAAKFVSPRAKAIRAFCGAAADDLKDNFLARSDMLHSDRCFWLVRILPATGQKCFT